MKQILLCIFLFLTFNSNSQNVSTINSHIQLPDSLNQITELRIYNGFGITNHTSILRIYENELNKWNVEFYEYWSNIDDNKDYKVTKKILVPEKDIEFIYLNIVLNHVFNLPSMPEIDWKMIKKGEVIKVKKKINSKGDLQEKYEFKGRLRIGITDGYTCKIQVKNSKRKNTFSFSNIDGYYNYFPEIDELKFYMEIMTIVRNEFNIWTLN